VGGKVKNGTHLVNFNNVYPTYSSPSTLNHVLMDVDYMTVNEHLDVLSISYHNLLSDSRRRFTLCINLLQTRFGSDTGQRLDALQTPTSLHFYF
jgi:hypothetical protein